MLKHKKILHLVDDEVEARFWKNASVGDEEACWEWKLKLLPDGYGHFKLSDGRNYLAHRVSFTLHNWREIEEGLLILHDCHNRSCVNPFHLKEGTHRTNKIAAVDAGRVAHLIGENSNHHRLMDTDIREIRNLYSLGQTLAEIGRRFGVTPENISRIVKMETWKHVR